VGDRAQVVAVHWHGDYAALRASLSRLVERGQLCRLIERGEVGVQPAAIPRLPAPGRRGSVTEAGAAHLPAPGSKYGSTREPTPQANTEKPILAAGRSPLNRSSMILRVRDRKGPGSPAAQRRGSSPRRLSSWAVRRAAYGGRRRGRNGWARPLCGCHGEGEARGPRRGGRLGASHNGGAGFAGEGRRPYDSGGGGGAAAASVRGATRATQALLASGQTGCGHGRRERWRRGPEARR
jgi:hypothetical protein